MQVIPSELTDVLSEYRDEAKSGTVELDFREGRLLGIRLRPPTIERVIRCASAKVDRSKQ